MDHQFSLFHELLKAAVQLVVVIAGGSAISRLWQVRSQRAELSREMLRELNDIFKRLYAVRKEYHAILREPARDEVRIRVLLADAAILEATARTLLPQVAALKKREVRSTERLFDGIQRWRRAIERRERIFPEGVSVEIAEFNSHFERVRRSLI